MPLAGLQVHACRLAKGEISLSKFLSGGLKNNLSDDCDVDLSIKTLYFHFLYTSVCYVCYVMYAEVIKQLHI